MDLSNYSVKDFVLNETFQKWMLEADEEANIFWEDWLNAHPDKNGVNRRSQVNDPGVKRGK